ncbi:MAG: C25 family cysteine peptidase [Acidobacteriota bacterium]
MRSAESRFFSGSNYLKGCSRMVVTFARISLAMLVCLLVLPGIFAHGSKDVNIKVISDSGNRIVLNFKIEDYKMQSFKLGGDEYVQVWIPGEGNFVEKGAPSLPHVNRSIIIPDDQKMIINVLSANYEERSLKIAPSKGLISRKIDPSMVPYEFGAVYKVNAFYPGPLATLGDPYIMRDYRGLTVQINPFQHNPVTETLRIYSEITVEVSAIGQGGKNVLDRKGIKRSRIPAFEEIYAHHFLNYTRSESGGSSPQSELSSAYSPLDEQGDMLIIAHDPWIPNLNAFVSHKATMGITANVVGVSTIGNDATSIKNYIQEVYDTSDLAWVLLVGDAAQVATPYASGGASDPSYSKLAGNDDYPDIMVGRFSANSVDEVDTQVQRTIDYEAAPANDQEWFWRGVGIASAEGAGQGDEGQSDQEHIEEIRGWLLNFGYTLVDQIYDPGATDTQVTDAVNAGRGIINYCGHGWAQGWGTTGFDTNDVEALVNDNMLPFIISVACNNGEFDHYDPCFGEAWLRETNESTGAPTGAIGAYMSSISQSWAPPMEGQDEFNLLYTDPGEPYTSYGTMCFAGSCSMMDVYGSGGVDMFNTWIVFGDPSVRIIGTASKLVYESHTIDDSDPDYGNGDGNIDYGETIRMAVTLKNNQTEPATSVWAILSTSSSGVEIRDKVAYYPDVPGSGTAQSNFPHFTFTVSSGCGSDIRFKMEIHHDNGLTSYSSFTVKSGLKVETTYFQDDMETDKGWTVSGTETTNNWVREDPYGVWDDGGNMVQPPDDTTAAPGVKCWVTGNPNPKGKFNPGDGDVDALAVLESPVFDASGASALTLQFNRFVYHFKNTDLDNSYFDIAISNDAGASYHNLETVGGMANEWQTKSLNASGAVTPTSQMKIRVRVEQAGYPMGDFVIDATLDDVRCYGTHYECQSFVPPAANPPNPVGSSLRVVKENANVKLIWEEPPIDASHDAATLYRIYRSSQPNAGLTQIATTTATFYLDLNELNTTDSWYYKVVSENGGGTSDE